jgi:hypothetical protein
MKENGEKKNSYKIVIENFESKKQFWTLGSYMKILH